VTFQSQLRIPGPTPLPDRVVRAMSRPMIDHRGPQFAAILSEITAGAKRVFKTKNDLLMLTSSGTGGLESAVANLVSPGDEVVVALSGNFGERFAAPLRLTEPRSIVWSSTGESRSIRLSSSLSWSATRKPRCCS